MKVTNGQMLRAIAFVAEACEESHPNLLNELLVAYQHDVANGSQDFSQTFAYILSFLPPPTKVNQDEFR